MAALISRPKLLVVALALLGEAALATPDTFSEYEVKAAFLYNFAKFIDWPQESGAEPKQPFVIGVLGEDPFGQVLDETVAGKQVRGRGFVVKRFLSANDLEPCHILFIAASERRHLDPIFARLRSRATLTVSEVEGFAESGGMINFTIDALRVRFEINLVVLEDARLKANSQMLNLARIIRGPPRAPGES